MQSIQVVALVIVSIGCLVIFGIVYQSLEQSASERIGPAAENAANTAGSRAIKVNEIYTENGMGQTPGTIDAMYIRAKLAPGSTPITLQNLLIDLAVEGNGTTAYNYNSSINCSSTNSSSSESIYGNSNQVFGIKYLLQGGDGRLGTLAQGDLTLFCLKMPRSITNDEKLSITIIPKGGTKFTADIEMPENIKNDRVVIYKRA